MIAAVRALAGAAGAFLFPQRCPACGAPARADVLLCAPCLAAIPRLDLALCPRCLRAGDDPSACVRHATRVRAAWIYDERAALAVTALKFAGRPTLAAALGPVLAPACAGPAPAAIVPVPLHPLRRLVRGYNQAESLAEALAELAEAPVLPDLLVRRRWTHPQTRLRSGARRRNVSQAFEARRPHRARGRRVLVVDDVMTTGATMDECMRTLEHAGARPEGLVLAWAQ